MRRSTTPLALAALLCAGVAGPAAAYDVVQVGGKVLSAQSLAFSGKRVILSTGTGPLAVDASSVDYYETFRRNLGHSGGNLVVFQTGALLRFDALEMADGQATVKVAGGARFVVPESLVDFESSVREGAMLKLPESATTGGVSVAKGGGGGAGGYEPPETIPDEPPPYEPPEAVPAGKPRPSPGFPKQRRMDTGKFGQSSEKFDPTTPAPHDDVVDGHVEQNPEKEQADFHQDNGQNGQDGQNGQNGQDQNDQVSAVTGQVVLVLSTTYGGEIAGLQAVVQYPRGLRIVDSVQFSGFAAALSMPTVNTRIPGQVQVIAVTQPGEDQAVQAGGEFLRITFMWTGHAPSLTDFAADVRATDATGGQVNGFPKEISLR